MIAPGFPDTPGGVSLRPLLNRNLRVGAALAAAHPDMHVGDPGRPQGSPLRERRTFAPANRRAVGLPPPRFDRPYVPALYTEITAQNPRSAIAERGFVDIFAGAKSIYGLRPFDIAALRYDRNPLSPHRAYRVQSTYRMQSIYRKSRGDLYRWRVSQWDTRRF